MIRSLHDNTRTENPEDIYGINSIYKLRGYSLPSEVYLQSGYIVLNRLYEVYICYIYVISIISCYISGQMRIHWYVLIVYQ